MKTLGLRGGDLVLRGRDLALVGGTAKIQQDLRGALLEPLGNDRFHPGWGATLNDFVSSIITPEVQFDIEAEVNRVISNYVSIQRDKIEADMYSDSETRFTTDEIVSRISDVSVTAVADQVSVSITLLTTSNEIVVLNEVLA